LGSSFTKDFMREGDRLDTLRWKTAN
jgi:hypothetical protein